MSKARRAAFEALMAVEGGATAPEALDRETKRLDERDAGLATELVFGVLRRRGQLDYLIASASGRGLDRMDREVLAALRMGAYQLRFLTRVPAHAAVSESVELVKRSRGAASGLVNAVLRRLPALPLRWPADEQRLSMPEWLLARWRRMYGKREAEQIAEAALLAPEPWLRVPPGQAVPKDGPMPEGGRFMDIGAQAVVPLLKLEAGERFLDVCAAPGNKTLQALETPVWAVACDGSRKRLRESLLAEVPRVVADAARELPFGRVFDRILVDAPCSGTGTLGRNPEIRWRVTIEEIRKQAERQKRILRNALECLKPGGRLVYSTCSLEPEENEEVVTEVAGERVQERVMRLPGREPGDGFFAAVIA